MTVYNKLVLGIDPGISSLGWSLVDDVNGKYSFVDGGVRIFDTVLEAKNGDPLNKKRRAKRLARRQLRRYKQRLVKVENIFIRNGFLDSKIDILNSFDEKGNISARVQEILGNPFVLRDLAINGYVSKAQFAYLILHLAKKRGYLQSLVDDETSDEIKHLNTSTQTVNDNRNSYIDKYGKEPTIGQILNFIYQKDLVDGAKERVVGITYFNKQVIHEFENIILNQKTHLNLEESLIKELRKIIFSRSQPKAYSHLKNNCELEKNKKVGNRTHPIYQEFKIWSLLNNLRYNTSVKLTLEQKNELYQLLSLKKIVTFNDAKKALLKTDPSLTNIIFNYEESNNEESNSGLVGNSIMELFPKNSEFVDKKYKKLPLRGLMSKESFMEDVFTIDKKEYSQSLEKRLVNFWNIEPTEAVYIIKKAIKIDNKTCSYSIKAMAKLLIELQKGNDLHESIGLVYPNHFAQVKVEKKFYITPFPDLRNPIVTKSLGQVRKLINTIVSKYGNLNEIRLELPRELKMGVEKLKKYNYELNLNKINNEKAMNDVERFELENNITFGQNGYCNYKDAVIRTKLYKELGGTYESASLLPYLRVKNGNVEKIYITYKNALLSSDTQIEHIIPKSIINDDSLNNITLCPVDINTDKKDKTILDYYTDLGLEDVYKEHLKTTNIKKMKKDKFFKFYSKADKYGKNNFTSNNLVDTSYIARSIKSHLESNGYSVSVIKGSHTSMSKSILFEKGFFESDFADIDSLKGKNRNDHRHHFVDALCVSVINDTALYKLNCIHKKEADSGLLAGYRKQLKNIANPKLLQDVDFKYKNMLISIEERLDMSGELNKETAYGLRKDKNGKLYFKTKVPISQLDKTDADAIANESLKKYAKTKYPDNLSLEGFGTIPRSFTKIVKYTESNMTRDYDKPEFSRTYYATGDNHHVEIWKNIKSGKLIERVVSLLEHATVSKCKNKDHPLIIKSLAFEKEMQDNGFDKILDLYKKSSYMYNGKIYTLMGISSGDVSLKQNHDARSLNDIELCERLRLRSLSQIEKLVLVKIDFLGNIIKEV